MNEPHAEVEVNKPNDTELYVLYSLADKVEALFKKLGKSHSPLAKQHSWYAPDSDENVPDNFVERINWDPKTEQLSIEIQEEFPYEKFRSSFELFKKQYGEIDVRAVVSLIISARLPFGPKVSIKHNYSFSSGNSLVSSWDTPPERITEQPQIEVFDSFIEGKLRI